MVDLRGEGKGRLERTLVAHRHHLQPAFRPIERRLLPRLAEKSRNSSVTVAVVGESM